MSTTPATTASASPGSAKHQSPRAKLDAAIGAICLDWWAALADSDLKTGKDGPNPHRAALAEMRRITTTDNNEIEQIEVSAAIGHRGFPAYLDLHRRLTGLLAKWNDSNRFDRFAKSMDFDDAVAVVAATLARVREHRKGDVAKLLGAKTRDEAPLMAEARFKRLIRTATAPDLLDQGRRIVMLLGRSAPVDDLGASLLLWNIDPYAKRRWSFAYYNAADMRADEPDEASTADNTAALNGF